VGGKTVIGREAADRPQSFSNQIFAVRRKLMTVSLNIGDHDLPGLYSTA
jgi:hypothetical protein